MATTKLDPYIAAALAAERRQRFRAEADSVRRADLAVGAYRPAPARSRLATTARLVAISVAERVRVPMRLRPRIAVS